MRSILRAVSLLVLCLLAAAAAAQAQSGPPGAPGQGLITRNSDCSVTITWTQATGATSYAIIAQFNNAVVPGSPFAVGSVVTIRTGPLNAGDYLIAIIALNAAGQTQGPPTSFIISPPCGGNTPPPGPSSPPGTPSLRQPTVTGNTVGLVIDPAGTGGTPSSYDIEAVVQATGQTFDLNIGQPTVSIPNVPAGNFLVRARARNAFGVSGWSPQRLVVVGVTLGSGDMQVTLTWNSTVDMDLHVIEPDGTHVHYANRNGRTARLDFDDTNGYGPENVFVNSGAAAAGNYIIYIVHYSGAVPTTSTITVRLNAGTASETVALFTRQTSAGNPGVGFNVAVVDVRNGIITETMGTRDEGPAFDAAKASAGSR
ncbi:MAG: hypothetical protein AB1635_12530 [Acidobacteriota bacterium]